jgi:hypothetical protein
VIMGTNVGMPAGCVITYTDRTGTAGNVTALMYPGPWSITLAAGATRTIRVAVTLTDPFGGGNTAHIYVGGQSTGNPSAIDMVLIDDTLTVRRGLDLTIGPAGSGGALGLGIINTTGNSQSEVVSVINAQTVTYDVIAKNTGNVADTLLLGGNVIVGSNVGIPAGCVITYTDRAGTAGNVTTLMYPGPWSVAVGAGKTITVRVTVQLSSPFAVGSTAHVYIGGQSSGDTTKVDIVRVDTTRIS